MFENDSGFSLRYVDSFWCIQSEEQWFLGAMEISASPEKHANSDLLDSWKVKLKNT